MKTIEINLYKFAELSKDAQQNAINNYRANQWANGDNLYFFSENCKEYLAEQGFLNANVKYSLSNSQGDGLSFAADLDVVRLIKEAKPDIKQSVLDTIVNNCVYECLGNEGNYYFPRPTDVSFYIDTNSYAEYNRLTDYVSDIKVYIQNKYMELCKKLETDGYDELEWEDSDEFISESLISNEYDFTEDGELY